MSNRYVVFEKAGGPEVLEIKEEPIPTAKDDVVVVKNESIGFNFIDTYYRKGLYPTEKPYRGGGEGAGIVHDITESTSKETGLVKGDKVYYLSGHAYTDYNAVPAGLIAKLPEGISFDVAAASLLKGLTAQYLIEKLYVPKKDEIILYHAGAGGVGLIFLQWARNLGVKVITTVSTDEKAKIALEYGAWKVFKYSDDIPERVKELTDGKKVQVVYDSVGKDTFEGSLNSLSRRGLLVSFGNASGAVPPFSLGELTSHGSLFVTRPSLASYLDNFKAQSQSFFKLVQDGTIKIQIGQNYKLADIRKLHTDAEARKTTGSTVIHP